MIRKLQRRFILITMVSVISIFILILAVLNISASYSAMQHGYATLQDYAMRDTADGIKALDTPDNIQISNPLKNPVPHAEGHFPAPDRNWFDNMRVLYVAYDSKGNIEDFSAGGNPDMTEAALLSMASSVLQQSKEKGRLGSYLHLLPETEDGTCLYFLDYGMEKSMSLRLLRICLYVGLPGIVLIFIPVFFLSRWITKPVQTAFDKQKQFIADASHGDKKILLVRNTGNGIPAEDQKHIFERFYRSEASRNRKYGGYGLGLAIASSIVTVHKGQLTVKSDSYLYCLHSHVFVKAVICLSDLKQDTAILHQETGDTDSSHFPDPVKFLSAVTKLQEFTQILCFCHNIHQFITDVFFFHLFKSLSAIRAELRSIYFHPLYSFLYAYHLSEGRLLPCQNDQVHTVQ